MAFRMQFLSDNAASVHPRVWAAMQAADAADSPYDTDRLSAELDDRFSALFGREVAALWVATGTAANCLALSALVPPHGGVVCHREAHIEMDECGAPGFYLHGAKLLLADGEHAKLDAAGIETVLAAIRPDVHQVQPHAIALTQTSEYGCCYTPGELTKIDILAGRRGLKLHMDGARFANAVAYLDRSPAEVAGPVDTLSFGFVKNGAMNAEAIVFFDPALADTVRFRRKRAGHLQSKGRFLAAQILAMLDGDTWLHNAAAANGAARAVAENAGERLLHPVEANEVFLACTAAEREALRGAGFAFYDWGAGAARFVAAWDTREEHARTLGRAIANL
jgi:threonine aldolase